VTPRSLAEAVALRAEADPTGELVRMAGGRGWTAAELYERAAEIARGLSRYVAGGDTVATALPGGPETIAVTVALSILGAVELPLGDNVDDDWARRLAVTTHCVLAITDEGELSRRPVLGTLGHGGAVSTVVTGSAPAAVPLEELIATAAPGLPSPGADLSRPAVVMPTSGTTGRPKGALLPNGAGIGQAQRVQRAMRYDTSDVLLNFFPWQHINARHSAFLPAVTSGARLVVDGRFSASRFWRIAHDEGITAFNFMGAVCAILLQQPVGPLDRDHRVSRGYGGPAPAWLVARMRERFGVELRQAYACTELADVATTGATVRPGAAGQIVPEYDVRVLLEDGRPAPEGTRGELQVRPRQENLTFLEYVGDPDATTAAWQDGWFRTGDQVRLEDDWLYFEGRSAEVIRRRGVNISPHLIEEVTLALPGVMEVAAVGVPSDLTEDDVLVAVVAAPGVDLQPGEIHRHCRERLPRACLPRYISIESQLPRNGSLKVLRAPLRERGVPANAWDAEALASDPPPAPSRTETA